MSQLLLHLPIMLRTWGTQWAKLIFQCSEYRIRIRCPFHLMQYLCLTSPLSLFSSCFDDRTQVSYHHKGQNFQSILSSNVLFWCFFSHNTPILSQPACPLNFTRPHLTPCLLPSFPSPFNISSPFHHQLPDIWTDEVAHKIPLIFCLEPCVLWEMWPGCDL